MKRPDRKLRRLTVALAYTLSVSAYVGLIILGRAKGDKILDDQLIGNFIEWFGILFSVMLGLIVVQVWAKYNVVDSLIDKEADALVSLLRFASFIQHTPAFDLLVAEISSYCSLLSQAGESAMKRTQEVIVRYQKIYAQVHAFLPACANCPHIAQEVIRAYDLAIDTRGDRDSLMKVRTRRELWFLVILASLIWLLSFFWLNYDNVNIIVTAVMLLGTTVIVGGILYSAKDIDDPTSGFWKASFDYFGEALAEIEFIRNSCTSGRC